MADTKVNSAGEQQPVDDRSRYAKMSASELGKELAQEITEEVVSGAKSASKTVIDYERRFGKIKPETLPLPDETLPHSVGAKWTNLEIQGPDGKVYHFSEGSTLRNKEIFAGGKCKRKIDEADRLMKQYPGGREESWVKVKAQATIVDAHGKESEAEVHWYEEPSIGKKEGKVKKWM